GGAAGDGVPGRARVACPGPAPGGVTRRTRGPRQGRGRRRRVGRRPPRIARVGGRGLGGGVARVAGDGGGDDGDLHRPAVAPAGVAEGDRVGGDGAVHGPAHTGGRAHRHARPARDRVRRPARPGVATGGDDARVVDGIAGAARC